MSNEKIDVIYMTGRRGGFENILNQVGADLSRRGFRVRFVQMVETDLAWTVPEVEFHCLQLNREAFSFDTAREVYAGLLRQDAEKPALIFVAGWPYLNYVAKGAASDAELAVPVAAWLHADLSFYEEGGCGGRDMLRFADMCFAINNIIASGIYEAYPEKVIYRVNNTIEPEMASFSEERNTHKLCYVGRLSDEKAFPFVLYALEQTKVPWEIEVIGDGADAEALKALSKELRLTERVHFRGWSDRPWHRLTDCRATVISSLYEGGPLSAMEALASGMQVVATPVGVLPEVIREGVNGALVPFGDPKALAQAFDRLAETPFTPETAAACRDSASAFYPEAALHDFAAKTEACIRCVGLAQRFAPGKQDLFVR